jgi:hypothetical protein
VKYLAATAIALALAAPAAQAQNIAGVRVVTTCGSVAPFPAIHAGQVSSLYVDTNGDICGGGGGGGGGGTSSAFGSTFPGTGTAAGFNAASGNMTGASVSTWGTAPTGLQVLGVNADILTMPAIPAGSNTIGTVNLGTIGAAATAANQEVTAAGTSASSAQAVQGVTNGVPFPTKNGQWVSAGAGQYNLSITSVTTLTVPSGTTIATIAVNGASAYYTDDGSTPAVGTGIGPIPAGAIFQYAGPLASTKWIAGSGGTLSLSYYK